MDRIKSLSLCAAVVAKLRSSVSFQPVNEILDQNNIFTALLYKLEVATNVKRQTIFLGGLCFILFYLSVGYAANLLCYFLGFVFPTYASVRAIESGDVSDDTKWLTYWVVFSTVNFLEIFVEWIPLYYLLKFILLVWCMFPGPWSGTIVVYNLLIRPFVMRHRDKVDTAISEVAKHVRKAAEKAAEDYEPIASVDLFNDIANIGGASLVSHEADESTGEEDDTCKKEE